MGVESGNLLTAVELYRLLPLKVGNRSIRVLQLSTDQSKPLEGKLKVISLSSYLRSPFVALSYAWGNTDESHRILCHASTTKSLPAYISITANCCDALMQLRRNQASRWPSSSSIDIWVDAVCINQDAKEGAEEKLTQIPLMQEIYQKAKAVFIWLGTGTQESDLAMEWLTKTSMGRELLSLIKFRAFPANMLPGEIIRLIRIAPELAKGGIFLPFISDFDHSYSANLVYHSWAPKRTRKPIDPKHLKDICQREWYSRMWTVQELVMASEPIVICGSKSLRWTPFFWAMVEALEPHSTTHSPLFAKAFNSVVAVTSLWYDLYRKKEFSQPVVRAWANSIQPTLLGAIAHLFLSFLESSFRIILCVGGFSATLVASMGILQGLRPLDNIWILPPLLLMAFTFLLRPGGPREEQKNNFRESLIDVLNLSRSKQATLPEDKVYALYGVLKSLGFEVQTPVKGMSFEDVYLDFTRQTIQFLGSMELLRISGTSKSNKMRLENLPSWVPDWRYSYDPISLRYCNAADTSRSEFEFSNSGREIITKGVVLDIVDSVIMNSTNIDAITTSSNPDLVVPYLIESIDQLCSWIRTVQNIYKSIGRSPSDCIFEVLHSNTTNPMYMSDELHINFHKWFQLLAPDGSSLNGMHGNVLRIAEKVANDDNTLRYHLFLLKLIYGRVLLATKQGYIGTGPWNTEVNDRVFLIPGCSLPGIFRTREETGYTVVGAAHIHGVMEGKVWETLENRVHDIVLL